MNSAGFESERPGRRLRQLRTALRSEKGQIVLMSALTLPVLLGIAALTIDASFMYEKRNRMHAAADAAAKSAAMEVRRGNVSGGNLLAYAQREVGAMGFSNSVIQAVNCPPASGSYTGGVCGTTSSYVEVILRETTPTFFARVLGFVSMTPTARAVAGASRSTNCLIALASSGTGLSLGTGATVDATNCGVAVNSTSSSALAFGTGARLVADSVGVSGNWVPGTGSSVSPTPQVGVPPTSDPLTGLRAPDSTGSCTTPYTVGVGATATISAGPIYCGFTVNTGGRLNLNAGNYVVNGTISIGTGAEINGTGVLIYKASGIFDLGTGAEFNIVAPTTGTYAGIAFFQPSTNTSPTLNVGTGGHFNVAGVTYAPNAQFRVLTGAFLSTDCTVVVALSLELGTGAGFGGSCSVFGGNPLRTVTIAE